MIVDPWGAVLARRRDEPERVVVADLDLEAQARGARASCRRSRTGSPDAYRWPEPAQGARDERAARGRDGNASTSGA